MKRSLALTLLFSLACGGLTSTTDPTEGPGATDPLPDEITPPEGYVAPTLLGGRWGLTDATGRWFSAPVYIRLTRDGPLWVGVREGPIELLIPPHIIETPCISVTRFSSEGVAGCLDYDSVRWALIDREGKLTTPPIWSSLSGPRGGGSFYVCPSDAPTRCEMVDAKGVRTGQIVPGPDARIKVLGPGRVAIGEATDRKTEVYGSPHGDQRGALVEVPVWAWRIADNELNEVLDCGDHEPIATAGSLALTLTHGAPQTFGVRGPDGWIWQAPADEPTVQRGAFLSEDLVALGRKTRSPAASIEWTLLDLPTGQTSDTFRPPDPTAVPRLSEGRIAAEIGGTCGWLDRHGDKVAGFEPGMTQCSDWEDGQGTSAGADGERIWR